MKGPHWEYMFVDCINVTAKCMTRNWIIINPTLRRQRFSVEFILKYWNVFLPVRQEIWVALQPPTSLHGVVT
jgi:hypothetical protein